MLRGGQRLFLLRVKKDGAVPDFSPWLGDGRLIPGSLYLSSLYVRSCVQISLCKDIDHIGLEPALTSLSLDHLCKDPISKKGHILRYWGLSFQHMNFGVGGDKVQPMTQVDQILS